MSKYDYVVSWPVKEHIRGKGDVYWFLPAHDEYCIESADQIYITKSFGERINKANMGNIISGFTLTGRKITVKISSSRRY